MTPLTHAAVGTALYEKLRVHPTLKFLIFPLAFLSHYALDAIPHYEEFGPLFRYRESMWLFLGLSGIGLAFAWLIWRWNREAARVWLLLCLWIGLGSYGSTGWRILTTLAIFGIALANRGLRSRLGYLMAGLFALSADFFPESWHTMRAVHDTIHYHTDWGTLLYRTFVGVPVPSSWRMQSASPYFLAGWGLEILVESCVFFIAIWILAHGSLAETKSDPMTPKSYSSSAVPSDTNPVAS